MKFDEKENFSALAFKVANDLVCRFSNIYQNIFGNIKCRYSILNSSKDKDERIGRML